MVYSNINGTVFYKENGNIDPEDIGYESTLYELEIYDKKVLVVFGKIKHTFIQRNIVYLPIYLVVNNKVKKQIGVVEFDKNVTLELFDDNDELDLDKLNTPLLFGFVDKSYIDRSGSDSISFITKQDLMEKEEKKEKEDEEELEKIDEEEESDEDDVLSVKVKPSKMSNEMKKSSKILEDGIFTLDREVKILNPLVEENEEMANEIKKSYEPSSRNNWLQEYMKNENYGIHDVENNGDCFFAVVRDAFKQIGQVTTVKKLRALIAKEVTEEVFEEHRVLFNDLKGTINEYNKELKSIKHTIENVLNKRAKQVSNDRAELQGILAESEKLKQQHKNVLKNKQIAQSMIDEDIGNIQSIDSLEKFREFIQTSGFWADSWAISVLEYMLKVKFVLLSQRSYLDNDLYNVLLCGEAHQKIQETLKFEPKYYIMTSFSGDHYQLVTYKNKRIFEFFELPYHVKALITNKCLEGNSGAFKLIPEIKNMKLKMGLDEEDELEENIENSSIYNKDIVFVFHRNSSNAFKPGMAKNTNEKIPADKRSLFIDLSKISNWRRKLDDTWMEAPFELNGKKWASVEHYYQSAKFRIHNPDFSDLFSLDATESEIAKDVDLAISAGSKSGRANAKAKKKVKGDTLLRPKGIEIDPKFYGEKSDQERLNAVNAKFSKNEDLKKVLLATRDAKLMQFNHGSSPDTDHMLMAVRHELNNVLQN